VELRAVLHLESLHSHVVALEEPQRLEINQHQLVLYRTATKRQVLVDLAVNTVKIRGWVRPLTTGLSQGPCVSPPL
jgi:hypothetical protein